MSTQRPPELTTEQAAWIAGVEQYVVRKWIQRGWVRRTSRGLVDGESLMLHLDYRGTGQQERDERGRYKGRAPTD